MFTYTSRPINLTLLYLTLGCVPAIFSSGCAVIEEIRSDGSMRREIAIGALVNTVPTSPQQNSVIRISGLGVASSPDAVTLGYFNNSAVTLDPTCRIVLIGNTPEQLNYFVNLVPNTQGICGEIATNGDQK